MKKMKVHLKSITIKILFDMRSTFIRLVFVKVYCRR